MSDSDLIRICSVGGNAVSAFLSWRLQATNACDVTLVWKSGYEHVSQYGISFKYISSLRFPGDAPNSDLPFLDLKALVMSDSNLDEVRPRDSLTPRATIS